MRYTYFSCFMIALVRRVGGLPGEHMILSDEGALTGARCVGPFNRHSEE
jgi:hypothetical protein